MTPAQRWSREVRPLAVRVTLMAALLTGLIGVCLMMANSLLHSGNNATISVPGRQVHITNPSAAVLLALAGILLWALLGSLSKLLVARQVRTFLRKRQDAPRPEESVNDEEPGSPRLMNERLLLEAHLAMWSLGTRLAVLAVLLTWLLPWAARVGLLVVAGCLAVIVRRRIGAGKQVYREFRTATQAARNGFSEGLIDAIYDREVVVQRLPSLEVLVLALTSLGLVLLPLWLFQRTSLAVTSVWIILMFQAVLSMATSAATLGWRQEAFFGEPLSAPLRPDPETGRELAQVRRNPVQGTLILTDLPNRWPRADAVMVRRDPVSPVLMVLAEGAWCGGVPLTVLATVLDENGRGLVAVNRERQSEALRALAGMPDLPVLAVPPELADSWPTASVVRFTDDALDGHLNRGVEVPGVQEWLGPARNIVSTATWTETPDRNAACQLHRGQDATETWLAVLDSFRTPPASVRALAQVSHPQADLVTVCDLSGAGFHHGFPGLGETSIDALATIEQTLETLPPVTTVIGSRSGARPAAEMADALGVDHIVLFNPEREPTPAAAVVHVSRHAARRLERAEQWAHPHGTLILHDTGFADLPTWLARHGDLRAALEPGQRVELDPDRSVGHGWRHE